MEQEATLARGTLALANLSTSTFPSHLRMPENPTTLATIVKVLHHAARGIRLASITWLPPSVLFGIRNMTGDDKICRLLVDSGLVFVLAGIIMETSEWDEECGESTLGLSIDVADNRERTLNPFPVLNYPKTVSIPRPKASTEQAVVGTSPLPWLASTRPSLKTISPSSFYVARSDLRRFGPRFLILAMLRPSLEAVIFGSRFVGRWNRCVAPQSF